MPDRLALFPLQLVAFPGESVNLHVFEPRYRDLLADAEREGIRFGVPTVMDGRLLPIATELRLVRVAKRYPGGESDITARGTRIFRIESFERVSGDKRYPGGRVEFLTYEREEDAATNARIIELTRAIYRVLRVERPVKEITEGFRTYDIAHYVGLTLEQEYEFLTLRRAKARQAFLLRHLEGVRPDVSDELKIRARARLNGHFQHLKPPNF